MPSHGLPRENESAGPGTRLLENQTVSVADGDSLDTGYDTVYLVGAVVVSGTNHSVGVSDNSDGVLTIALYDVEGNASQGTAQDVEVTYIADR
jgi:hypothetical protein